MGASSRNTKPREGEPLPRQPLRHAGACCTGRATRATTSDLVRIMGLEALQRGEGLGDRRRSPNSTLRGSILPRIRLCRCAPPIYRPICQAPSESAAWTAWTAGVDKMDKNGQNGQKIDHVRTWTVLAIFRTALRGLRGTRLRWTCPDMSGHVRKLSGHLRATTPHFHWRGPLYASSVTKPQR